MKRGPKPQPPATPVAAGEVSIGRGRMVYVRRLSTGEDGADRLLLYGGWASGTGAAARSCVQMPATMADELVKVLREVAK
jgi:hypothetical protein